MKKAYILISAIMLATLLSSCSVKDADGDDESDNADNSGYENGMRFTDNNDYGEQFDGVFQRVLLNDNYNIDLIISDSPGQYNDVLIIGDNLWVTDKLNHCIYVMDKDGSIKKTIGSFGSKPGQFNEPNQICADDKGNVYVIDTKNYRVQKLSPEGEFEDEYIFPGFRELLTDLTGIPGANLSYTHFFLDLDYIDGKLYASTSNATAKSMCGLYEIDLKTKTVTKYLEGMAGCIKRDTDGEVYFIPRMEITWDENGARKKISTVGNFNVLKFIGKIGDEKLEPVKTCALNTLSGLLPFEGLYNDVAVSGGTLYFNAMASLIIYSLKDGYIGGYSSVFAFNNDIFYRKNGDKISGGYMRGMAMDGDGTIYLCAYNEDNDGMVLKVTPLPEP